MQRLHTLSQHFSLLQITPIPKSNKISIRIANDKRMNANAVETAIQLVDIFKN
jgi:hypothetical protein